MVGKRDIQESMEEESMSFKRLKQDLDDEERNGGEFDGEDEEAPFEWSGNYDEKGVPHGPGRLVDKITNTVFTGELKHGLKYGKGIIENEDGSRLLGTFFDDELDGIVVELDNDGDVCSEGVWYNGRKIWGREWMEGGGVLVGYYALEEDEEVEDSDEDVNDLEDSIHDEDAFFLFFPTELRPLNEIPITKDSINISLPNHLLNLPKPLQQCLQSCQLATRLDSRSVPQLRGKWIKGNMVNAKYVYNLTNNYSDRCYSYDPSTDKRISSDPLLASPYEEERTFVAKSSIPNANEGLFAKIPIPANTIVSFYNGIRVPHEIVDSRDWEQNSNTISLGDVVIDVEEEFIDTKNYCASLGHKVNHSFDESKRNCKYDFVYHPRFGSIRCIRTTKDVKAGEEFLLDYDYNEVLENAKLNAPNWYLSCL